MLFLLLLQISEETFNLLPPQQQAYFDQRDAVEVKGKGVMKTFVTRMQPQQVPRSTALQLQQMQGLPAGPGIPAAGGCTAGPAARVMA